MLKQGPAPRHRRALAALAVGVALVHALLLGSADEARQPPRMAHAPAVQVRAIDAPPPPTSVSAGELGTPAVVDPPAPARPALRRAAPGPVEPPRPVPAPAAAAAPAGTPPPADPQPSPQTAPRPAPGPDVDPPDTVVAEALPLLPVVASANGAARRAARPSPSSAAPEEPPAPTYVTRLPPNATLRYDLRRGVLSGTGEMRWHLEAGRYELRLDGTVLGIPVLVQISQGGIDAAGVAPLRFTDQRARRSPVAANFRREAHSVSFSGGAAEVPLGEGAQDRLSWMVQLAAIVAADPGRAAVEAKTAMQVVGARGDSSVWVFRCLGTASVDTRAGAVSTVHFVRESRGPYDTAVEVWLDPARHHLPLRATMRNGGDGEVFELKLKDVSFAG